MLVLVDGASSYINSPRKPDQAGTLWTDKCVAAGQMIKQHMIAGTRLMCPLLGHKISVVGSPGTAQPGFLEVVKNGLIGLSYADDARRGHPQSSSGDGARPRFPRCVFLRVNWISINGMVSRAFGSRPEATFMMLFALVFGSEKLVAGGKWTEERATRRPGTPTRSLPRLT